MIFSNSLRYSSLLIYILGLFISISGYSAKPSPTGNDWSTEPLFYIQDTTDKNSIIKYHHAKLIAKLPLKISETSGLVYFDQMLWTINDGGNPAELYQVDTVSGAIIQTKRIINVLNNDWEAITQDSLYLFVGDFGNNSGNRTDLKILKIRKTDLLTTDSDIISAGNIYFHYPEQVSFNPVLQQTEFDCEAFFYHNDSLHLFTKDWVNQQTKHYTLPVDTGRYELNYIDSFEADGLITDAAINAEGTISLLGYKKNGKFWSCFCWLLSDYTNNCFFNGKKTRFELGSVFTLSQVEAIMLNNDNTAWISSESIFTPIFVLPAKLLKLDLNPALRNKP